MYARALAVLLFSALALAQDALPRAPLPLSEVAPGMTGYGLSAGPGNVIERFDAEVLAVQETMGPGFALVLIRTGGDSIERSGGMAAGMSGCPIYSGDKLLGAPAYAFAQSDHRLALVTPAEVLLATDADTDADARNAAPGLDALGAVVLRAPVVLSGLSERVARELEARVGLFGGEVLPLQTGRMSAADDLAYRLEPGSAVTVEIAGWPDDGGWPEDGGGPEPSEEAPSAPAPTWTPAPEQLPPPVPLLKLPGALGETPCV